MKVALVLALAAACSQPNPIDERLGEAIALAAYYRPRLDALEARLVRLEARGPELRTQALPGHERAGAWVKVARNQLGDLQRLVAPGAWGPAEIEELANRLARAGDSAGLVQLVHERTERLDRDAARINAELTAAEAWLAGAETAVNAQQHRHLGD